MTRLPRFQWSLALMALLAFPLTAMAFPPGGRGGPDVTPEQRQEHMRQMRAHVKEVRGKVLRNKAALDEATASQVEAVLEKFDSQREQLFERKFAARKALRTLIRSDSSDAEAYDRALDENVAVHGQMHKLRLQQVAAIRATVDAKTAARVLATLHRLRRGMHHKMGRGPHGKRGPGCDGFGPGPGFSDGPEGDDDGVDL